MLGLSRYRLESDPSSPGLYRIVDPEDGRLVGLTRVEPGDEGDPGPIGALLGRLADPSCLLAPVMRIVLTPVFTIYFLGTVLGAWSLRYGKVDPRLIVRCPDGDEDVLMLRASTGIFSEGRRVLDGQGRPIAHFVSHAKRTVRGGFGVIDLRGLPDDVRGLGLRPWIGCVEPSGGTYRLTLLTDADAGRIVPEGSPPVPDRSEPPGAYTIEVAPGLRGETTVAILLLAAALTVAWRPP